MFRQRACDDSIRLQISGRADHIEDWFHAGAIDGFNLQPDRLIDGQYVIVDELAPLLRKRGLYRHRYETQTLREHVKASAATSGMAG